MYKEMAIITFRSIITLQMRRAGPRASTICYKAVVLFIIKTSSTCTNNLKMK
jgi:hypothetical protein